MTTLTVFVMRDPSLLKQEIGAGPATAWCAERVLEARHAGLHVWMTSPDLLKPLRDELTAAGVIGDHAFRAVENRYILKAGLSTQPTVRAIILEGQAHFGSRFQRVLVLEPRWPLLGAGIYDSLFGDERPGRLIPAVRLTNAVGVTPDDERPRNIACLLQGVYACGVDSTTWGKTVTTDIPRWRAHDLGDPADRLVIRSLITTGDV